MSEYLAPCGPQRIQASVSLKAEDDGKGCRSPNVRTTRVREYLGSRANWNEYQHEELRC
jgi:hypothetical protein